MKKWNRILAVAAATLVMASALAGCSSKPAETTPAPTETEATTPEGEAPADQTTEAETSAEGGQLVMATNAEFPPYEYREGDQIVGIDAEIAQAIAEEMGMTLKIEDMNFDSILAAIQSGKADFGAAGMTITPDRQESVDFSDTYAKATQMIIVKKGNEDIKGPDDLTGKKIGVQLGTTGDIYCDDIEGAQVERYNKGFEAVQALSQGKIDAVIIDGEPAKAFAKENQEVEVLETPFTEEAYAIAVKKGNQELLDKINAAIATLKESGKLQEINDKYITAE